MKPSDRKIGAMPLFSFLILAALFLTWGAAMLCTTNALAHSYYVTMLEEIDQYGQNFGIGIRTRYASGVFADHPGYLDFEMLRLIQSAGNASSGSRTYDFASVLDSKGFNYQRAAYFCDAEGSILHQSGSYGTFRYLTEEQWLAEADETEAECYAYMALPYDAAKTLAFGSESASVIRVTGVMNGNEITPCKLDYLTHDDVRRAVQQTEPVYQIDHGDGSSEIRYSYTHSGLDAQGLLEWRPLFDHSAEIDEPTVTLYSAFCFFGYYDEGQPVSDHDGQQHENLLALLLSGADRYHLEFPFSVPDKRGLDEIIVFEVQHYGPENSYGYIEDYDMASVVATRCSPMKEAVRSLKKVYIGTFALTALLAFLLIKAVDHWLCAPVNRVIREAEGWNAVHWSSADAAFLKENYRLYETYRKALDTMNSQRAEITRLNHALEYSQKAEQERRRLTSDVAHELKTPLAVIHSYAEGLQQHIAEDKRDRYLEVILSETERMDALVLEQLDLSRLEAGRIKLARDEFAPAHLIRDCFSRFDLLAADKKLDITFDLNEQLIITADEGRLGQVITNLASNAIKYTPDGGNVRVELKAGQSMFSVRVCNDSPPLSEEALEHVWDPFYRADKSRSSKGSGLGLAIARQIIELHGGRCAVCNTETGVAFSFTLPY